jgi:catechol 2,3-dioxygenase-like lactoylglutathione lyase family enzyme
LTSEVTLSIIVAILKALGGPNVEHIIASLLHEFEAGKMNRRQLIQNLAAAATGASVVSSVPAAAATGDDLKTIGIGHLSYRVANYTQCRDFYSRLLGMKVSGEEGKECNLSVGDLFIHLNGSNSPLHVVDGVRTPLRTPMIDHIEYKFDMNKKAILAELVRRGYKSQAKDDKPDTGIRIKDPDGFDVTLVATK